MTKSAALAALAMLATASPAMAQDNERLMMMRVRLTTDPIVPPGCIFIATVVDDSLKDLRRKIVRLGGDTGVLSFPPHDIERIHAQIYRCPPPPPPGPPPPPPPR